MSPEEWQRVQFSFAQFGEDSLVIRAFESLQFKHPGFYVDIGAHDPIIYSNTLRLRHIGWRGINVDANPANIARFDALCPNERNLCLAIAESERKAEFLIYPSATTGRLASPEESRLSILGEEPAESRTVQTARLDTVLDEYLPPSVAVDFLSVDCEGADLEVLRSSNWVRYRPLVLAVEDHELVGKTETDKFCSQQGYRLFAQAHVTKIFMRIGD